MQFETFGVCSIPLEMYFQPFQLCITCSETSKLVVVEPQKQICSRLTAVNHVGQKNHNRFWMRLFWASFSTSDTKVILHSIKIGVTCELE